jgi:glycosyltransferase involved in cell wall biosynthesis
MSLVSAVIPTRHRPQLVLRAINSVLNQTHRELELIVVVDGPDDATVEVINGLDDPRLRLIVNPRSMTAAGARNIGAAQATGEWIAFLDDDDEWLFDKIEKQLAFAAGCGTALVSCISRVVTPLATHVWPRVIYDNSTALDEYLFNQRLGSGFIQTSSFLLPREIFDKVKFNVDSPHDDWEFVIRLSKEVGVKIATVPEVLVILYFEEARSSLSTSATWLASLRWIESMRPLVTPQAYGAFCLGVVGSRAAQEGAYRAFPKLLWKSFQGGSPRVRNVLFYLAFWLVPQKSRRRIRALLQFRTRQLFRPQ